MTSTRVVITGVNEEKLDYVKDFLRISKSTDVFRKLLDDKYEEIKKLRLASNHNSKLKEKI